MNATDRNSFVTRYSHRGTALWPPPRYFALLSRIVAQLPNFLDKICAGGFNACGLARRDNDLVAGCPSDDGVAMIEIEIGDEVPGSDLREATVGKVR